MKGMLLAIAILLVFLLSGVSALRINEVEINPLSGNEWVELYNDGSSDINLSELQIWEGVYGSSGPRKIKIHLEGIISEGQYYVIDLNSSSILNNDGDFILLKNLNNETIDEIPKLKELSPATSKTWQLCSSEWKFLEATKGAINSCPIQTPTETQNNSEQINQSVINETITPNTITQTSSPPILEDKVVKQTQELTPINLSKNIKTQNGNEGNKKYAIYGFIGFCILLTILFVLKGKGRKNEFR